ncbi:type II secretion system protein GspC [Halieaceae bacterium IMCC14734]|uniref:Type II secretion system protein GspC n=1 Tax=Candidatus Litorirhabdus singularis TaxID=2518993 RepID=A0ABT3TFE4_9GAMM|nr:type II secretion system protein GspC [Candidatus Litorirhabdus singularis]MCX2981040.1 type II secretion system protein GspC [Candidatus Litorirhabdus singularis]
MASEWSGSLNDRMGAGLALASTQVRRLAEPAILRRILRLTCVLAVLWILLALVQLLWALLPAPDAAGVSTVVINPLTGSRAVQSQDPVAVDKMLSWNLFGTEDSKLARVAASEVPEAAPADTDGIEKNAKETRLSLRLQGLATSPDPRYARAIIEYQGRQEQYAIDDKLPVSGRVTLAKVLPDRVVLNNSGKYELLLLFNEAESSAALVAEPAAPAKKMTRRQSKDVEELAQSYRERLYSNPQSLAEVVKISAVRDEGRLQGYRVSAGKDKEQFEALGFQPNDLVTAVNGIELDDPGKAMELYRVMRSAKEASFSIRRGEEDVTLSVGLDGQEAQ